MCDQWREEGRAEPRAAPRTAVSAFSLVFLGGFCSSQDSGCPGQSHAGGRPSGRQAGRALGGQAAVRLLRCP